jgi:hypothetical protein
VLSLKFLPQFPNATAGPSASVAAVTFAQDDSFIHEASRIHGAALDLMTLALF